MIGWCYEGWNRGNVLELVGVKKEIMKDIVGQFGCYYRELVCNRRMVGKDVMRFVRGGLAVGGWVGFYDVKVLDCKVR